MALVSGLMVAAAIAATHAESFTHFDNYTRAHGAAQLVGRPMLVILNPAADSSADPVELQEVRRTVQRRELLEEYVVCVLDTSTEHGAQCQELFEATDLPRVVVIDKQQKMQIFRTSQPLDNELWSQVLISFRDGVAGPNPLTKTISSSRSVNQNPTATAPLRYSQPCST